MKSDAVVGGTPPYTPPPFHLWRYEYISEKLLLVGGVVSIYDSYVMNTVCTLLPELSDEKVSLIL